jgi:hypothetical protein
MVLTAYSVLSPAIGLFVTVTSAMQNQCGRLDISVEISGPHGLAVRFPHVRLSRARRPSQSRAQRSVTIAKRPSIQGHGTRGEMHLICPTPQARRLRQIGTTGKSLEQDKILSSEEPLDLVR